MQTTLRIDDDLYREAKAEAAREGITLTRFLEDAMRLKLNNPRQKSSGKPHPFPLYQPAEPLNLTSEQIKQIDQDLQLQHHLAQLGIQIETE